MFSMMLISLTGALVLDLICPIPPETGYGPESPTYKEIIREDRAVLNQRKLETDTFGDVILSSATCVLKVTP